MLLIRGIAIVVGLGAIAAVTHGTIMATGGYGLDTNAPMLIALALVQAVLAMTIGDCFAKRRRALASLAILVLVGLRDLQLHRDSQPPARQHRDARRAHPRAEAKRKAAEAFVARLERDDRVERAEQAAKVARADANARSTDKGCGPSCRATLAKTVDDADGRGG